ncbi:MULTISPECIES: ankyrin repeat domain-containing protein [Enterobacteriaceae]|uniref:ankyrin repeat domain-containing protein n=1 Tax=Enterobacteriaceae TaxID=543 RepID=UPI0006683794|nr:MULTISPECIES: ankyrin repeat domain-containing protein [Enterobacteriaceae]
MNNYTTLNLLFSETKKDVQNCIAAGINVNSTLYENGNALFYNHHFNAIKAMIEAGIDLNYINHFGNNALFNYNTPKILRLLIDSGINIHQTNQMGDNCLASHWRNVECMKILTDAGINIHNKDSNGQTILHKTYDNDSFDYMVNAGCDINHRDSNGLAPLDLTGKSGKEYDFIVAALARHIDKIDTLPTLFKHLSVESLPLIALLHKKGLQFTITQQCTFTLYVREMKEFFTELKKYTNISHINFYNLGNQEHIGTYTGIERVKWFIRNDIRIDDDILRQRADSDKIFDYIAGRENKDLFKIMKPELKLNPKRRRI